MRSKKQLIMAIGRNIYVINLLNSLGKRIRTLRVTLGMVKSLLNGEESETLNQLIERVDGLLVNYTPRREQYCGDYDAEVFNILDELIQLCMDYDILSFDFTKLSLDDLFDEKNEKDEVFGGKAWDMS